MLADLRFSRGDSRPRDPSTVNSKAGLIEKIEAAQKKFRLTQEAFCAAAGVSLSSYKRYLAGTHATQPHLIHRLKAAAEGKAMPQPHPRLIAAMHRSTMAVVAAELGHDVKEILAMDFASNRTPRWAAEVRRIAMYVIVVEAAICNGAALGRAIGCTKQNVSQAIDAIEAARDEGSPLDRLIQKIPL